MLVNSKIQAALIILGAAFAIHNACAQAPIVDASVGADASTTSPPASPQQQDNSTGSSELFYQLQLLQQEVMQLRGQVEEQSYQLQQLKEQNMERYIDLDRRIGQLSEGSVGASSATAAGGSLAATQSQTATAARPGEKEAYDAAYSLVIGKQFDKALKAFKQFLADYPGGKLAANSYYWMGELYQVVTPPNLDAAREAFSQLLDQYPDHPKVPDAMYKLGKVHFLKGNLGTSRKWLEKVIAEYSTGSSSSAADKARQFLNANF